jgi:hypothetical protein
MVATAENMLAAAVPIFTLNPAVELRPAVEFDAPAIVEPEAYPEDVTLPEPICIRIFDAPFKLTPLNITVIRFTQLGMLVKSIEVPDVDATAVPEAMPLNIAPLGAVKPVVPSIVAVII